MVLENVCKIRGSQVRQCRSDSFEGGIARRKNRYIAEGVNGVDKFGRGQRASYTAQTCCDCGVGIGFGKSQNSVDDVHDAAGKVLVLIQRLISVGTSLLVTAYCHCHGCIGEEAGVEYDPVALLDCFHHLPACDIGIH